MSLPQWLDFYWCLWYYPLSYSQLTDQITKSPASEAAGESKIIFTRAKCIKRRITEKRFSISCICSASPFWLLSGAYILVAEIWQAICHKKILYIESGFFVVKQYLRSPNLLEGIQRTILYFFMLFCWLNANSHNFH